MTQLLTMLIVTLIIIAKILFTFTKSQKVHLILSIFISFNPDNSLIGKYYYYFLCTDEESKS